MRNRFQDTPEEKRDYPAELGTEKGEMEVPIPNNSIFSHLFLL